MTSPPTASLVSADEGKAITFKWVDLPTGPQPLPEWCIGASVRWNDGYANSPDLVIRADRDLRSWEGQSFVREGRALVARHDDGRVHQWGFQGEFRETEQVRHVNGQAEAFTIPATPPSEGCGGWPVDCLMADGPHAGRLVRIRGPWSIGQPAGYNDASYRVRKPVVIAGSSSFRDEIGLAGLGVSDDLFLCIVARFLPHCRVARIFRPGWRDRLEIADGFWDEPKSVRLDLQQIAYARPASHTPVSTDTPTAVSSPVAEGERA